MDKFKYDVYIGERNRTYLVATTNCDNRDDLIKAALKRFKKSRDQIIVRIGYIVGDELYLTDPDVKRCKMFWVAYLRPNIRRTTYGD